MNFLTNPKTEVRLLATELEVVLASIKVAFDRAFGGTRSSDDGAAVSDGSARA